MHRVLTRGPFKAAMAGVTFAEWWANSREADRPHQLHWDVDETRLRRGTAEYKLQHPVRRGGCNVSLDMGR